MVALFVVLVIATLLLFDWLVIERRAVRPAPAPAATPVPAMAPAAPLTALGPRQFALPMGLFFHPGHTWTGVLRSGQVKVGMDDFVRRLVGGVEAVALPRAGTAVARGDPFITLRQGGRSLVLRSPVDGTVVSANPAWETDRGAAWADPYGEGWLVKVLPTNLARNLRTMRIAEPAVWWLQEEVRRFRDFAAHLVAPDPDLGLRLADGGLPVDGVLRHVDDATWSRFQVEFLGA